MQNAAYSGSHQTRSYTQLMSAMKRREENKRQKGAFDERLDDEEDVSSKIIMSSTSTETLKFGRFCGQMKVSVRR